MTPPADDPPRPAAPPPRRSGKAGVVFRSLSFFAAMGPILALLAAMVAGIVWVVLRLLG